ncbi:MAG: hypothetical protein KAW41_06145 [Candidatus Diapherotrites archaeon]|nr:hypothetical protein [Candidatus Diapherotrites archaeon]
MGLLREIKRKKYYFLNVDKSYGELHSRLTRHTRQAKTRHENDVRPNGVRKLHKADTLPLLAAFHQSKKSIESYIKHFSECPDNDLLQQEANRFNQKINAVLAHAKANYGGLYAAIKAEHDYWLTGKETRRLHQLRGYYHFTNANDYFDQYTIQGAKNAQEEYQEAIKHFNRTIEVDPANDYSKRHAQTSKKNMALAKHNEQVYIHNQKKRHAAALTQQGHDLQTAARKFPIRQANQKLQNYEEAISLYRQALEYHTTSTEAKKGIALAQKNMEAVKQKALAEQKRLNKQKAAQLFQDAHETHKKANSMGEGNPFAIPDYNKAIDLYNRALQLVPEHPGATTKIKEAKQALSKSMLEELRRNNERAQREAERKKLVEDISDSVAKKLGDKIKKEEVKKTVQEKINTTSILNGCVSIGPSSGNRELGLLRLEADQLYERSPTRSTYRESLGNQYMDESIDDPAAGMRPAPGESEKDFLLRVIAVRRQHAREEEDPRYPFPR